MDLIKTMMANRREKGMLPEPPRGMARTATATTRLPDARGLGKGPSPSEELEAMKRDIIQKKPRNKVVRDYFQRVIDFKNGRAEAKELAAAREDD